MARKLNCKTCHVPLHTNSVRIGMKDCSRCRHRQRKILAKRAYRAAGREVGHALAPLVIAARMGC